MKIIFLGYGEFFKLKLKGTYVFKVNIRHISGHIKQNSREQFNKKSIITIKKRGGLK